MNFVKSNVADVENVDDPESDGDNKISNIDTSRVRRQSVSPKMRVVSSSSPAGGPYEEPKRVTLSPSGICLIVLRLPQRKLRSHHITSSYQPVIRRSGGSKCALGGRIDSSRFWFRRSRELFEKYGSVYYDDEELLNQINRYIAVCTISDMSVIDYEYFLRRVWIKRSAYEEETPVVAYPSFTAINVNNCDDEGDSLITIATVCETTVKIGISYQSSFICTHNSRCQ